MLDFTRRRRNDWVSNSRNREATIQIVLGTIATSIFNAIVFATLINLNYSILSNDGVAVLSDNMVLSIFSFRKFLGRLLAFAVFSIGIFS